jgi:hypothetical protein
MRYGGIGILSLLLLVGCATVQQSGPKYPDIRADGSSVDNLKYVTTKVVDQCGENWGIAVDLHVHPQRGEDYLVASYWVFEKRGENVNFSGPLAVSVKDGSKMYAWLVKDGQPILTTKEEISARYSRSCEMAPGYKKEQV